MPSILEHGASIPVRVPPVDPRNQRRPLPQEIMALRLDLSAWASAIRRLALEIFQPPLGLAEREEQFKRSLSSAINQTAQAAFTPRTTISYLEADQTISSEVWGDLTGLAQTLVVPVPARVHLILNITANCATMAGDFLEFRVNGAPPAVCCISRVRAIDAKFQWSVTAQDLFDAEPETVYSLSPQAQISGGGGSVFDLIAGAGGFLSSFTVRVEPRSLVVETPPVAVVHPPH